MSDLPSYVSLTFMSTVVATFGFLFYGIQSVKKTNASNNALIASTFIMVWLFITALLSLYDFLLVFDATPPRFLLVILPPIVGIVALLLIKTTRDYLCLIPITTLTYLHIVRVPVEIVLWWLASHQVLPYLMTFEGVNYDILSGISAPFVAIFMVGLRSKSRLGAIIWNFISMALLFHVVIYAVLSSPSPFQQFAFDQPNIAVFYFPFVWLPGFVVPVVLFSHLISLVKLFDKETELV